MATVAALLVATPLLCAQTRDLLGDVANLNIRHTTDHYALAGTVNDERFAEYGRALEYIHKEYATGFDELIAVGEKGRPAHADSAHRFKVVILATDAEYKEFGEAYFGRQAEYTRGLFVARAQLLLIRDEPTSHETYEILFHEAFHQFIDRYIPATPTWANEGLATYYGTASPTPKGLEFDRPRSAYFQVVRDAVGAKCLIPLKELMLFDRQAFYRSQAVDGLNVTRKTLAYAQAYTLIAYIVEDRAGRELLRRYLRNLAAAGAGAHVRRITLQSFPDDLLGALVPGWLKMVNRH